MKKAVLRIVLSLLALFVLFVAYFFTIRHLDQVPLAANAPPAHGTGQVAQLLPSYFLDEERFYLELPTVDGDTLLGFCDTGGGICMLLPHTNKKPGIRSRSRTGLLKGIMPVQYILFADLVPDHAIPAPWPLSNLVLRGPFRRITSPYLLIPPMEKELELMMEVQPEMDAFLGQAFFMHSAWTFDYPNREIWINTPLKAAEANAPNVQKLGFKKDEEHVKIFGHPRMQIEVDGEPLDVLFDTGATMILTDAGREQMGVKKKTLGASFIAASVFQAWRNAHPEWKYYPKADLIGDVIEVPIVKIGDFEVGPVLFAERPDENWSEGMIASMDQVVKGAIGGSALRYFKVTIDYNSELIRFDRNPAN